MKGLLFFGLFALLMIATAFASAQPVRVTIDASNPLKSINLFLYGINTARWDESLFPGNTDEMLRTADRDAIEKIKASGVTLLKYPGGNDADHYIWNSPNNNATEMDTDEYIALCREVGAEPFITINFNEPAELAAEWVRYCNQVKGYNVKLWEVGDEQWGTWAKGHASPEEYAKKYIAFVKAMRAVDPSIKVATNAPLGPHAENWTERVFRAAGEYIDMVTYTYFPQKWGHENDDTLLATPAQFRGLVLQLQRDIERTIGAEKAKSILIVNVGYNSVNHSPGPQTIQLVNALWVADMLGSMAELGTDIACYWALHNAFPPRSGDYGYLSSEGNNTPRYNYYVFPMFVNHFGNELVSVSSTSTAVSVYASRKEKGLSIALINKDKKSSKDVEIALHGFTPQRHGQAWILDEKRKYEKLPDITNASETFSMKLPPFSFVIAELIDRDSIVPPTNLATLAIPTASSFSTIGPHFKPISAIDGKLSTRWNSAAWTKSNGEEAQWFQLSWKQPQQLSVIRISWGESRGVNYVVKISNDGKTWKKVKEVTDGTGTEDEIQLPPAQARYLRIDGNRGTKSISAYSIREIEVYNK